MTLDEKVGQMCQVEQATLKDPADIARYSLGSVFSGGGSGPRRPEDNTPKGWTDLVDGYQQQALATRLRIPLLYGTDAVHGHNNVPGASIFPHTIGLGCTRNPELVEQIARVTAADVRATGINWVFAPCVTVPQDVRWGRTYEGFSEDPDLVQTLGAAAVRGLQGARLDDPLSVVACAKHFVGDGGTIYGTGKPDGGGRLDQGDTRLDETTLRRVHLPGYLAAIREGVATIMPSFSSWNGVKCTGHRYLLTDLLKHELGFDGFLISDYNAIDQLDVDYRRCIELAINAGLDMVMLTERYALFCSELKSLVARGKVPVSRINDAVTRILRVKIAAGLMEPDRSPLADRELQRSFGSAEHRALARRAVHESLVLLKNQNNALPLAKTAHRIHVAGAAADDLGVQCGGWTITWQGSPGNHVPGGTSILTAIRNAAAGHVAYSPDGTGAAGAAVAVVVIGEKPYAEWCGDRSELTLAPEDMATVANARSTGVPVVLVLLSGRPLILGPVLEQADAVIAAWLPGSEGQGVADVLFGDFAPTGKLSYTWPRALGTGIKHAGDAGYDALHALGYGLGYGE